ncbi:MAG TPA: hypothetical protein VMU41_12730 [Candidatus Binataceae bacterium]|nr:hypothetical protein [Candidatus Binataceae bacterium]
MELLIDRTVVDRTTGTRFEMKTWRIIAGFERREYRVTAGV